MEIFETEDPVRSNRLRPTPFWIPGLKMEIKMYLQKNSMKIFLGLEELNVGIVIN